MTKAAEVELKEEELEFARYTGPGTIMYPSPRADVRDLVLRPMTWTQVDEAYHKNGRWARDAKNKVFELIRAPQSPDDLDLSIPADYDRVLTDVDREAIRDIVLSPGELKPERKSALEIANNLDDSGLPRAGAHDKLNVTYLREHHRPFLLALKAVEMRYQKRKAITSLIDKHLARISKLPNDRNS